MNGEVTKRKKRPSKSIYGTSHIISLDEAGHVFQNCAGRLIVGSGQSGLARLSEDAPGYFQCQACNVDLLPTGKAIEAWDQAEGAVIGLFYITC